MAEEKNTREVVWQDLVNAGIVLLILFIPFIFHLASPGGYWTTLLFKNDKVFVYYIVTYGLWFFLLTKIDILNNPKRFSKNENDDIGEKKF